MISSLNLEPIKLVSRLGLSRSEALCAPPGRPSSKPAAGQIVARRSASLLNLGHFKV